MSARATDLAPGTVLAERYRLERLVGQGGMAAIWAAEDVATGARIALKLMKDAAGDAEARQRFVREARAAQLVRHPGVVRIFEVLELDGGLPAIAMELLDGESLRARLNRERSLALAGLADVLVPVASAVGAAHALGIVHRDLKPENIFLARDGGHGGGGGSSDERVVVLDFGIAKLTALDGDAMRSTGLTTTAVLGTPAYMAPEQVFGERDIDHRADIWALGVVIYECLSGIRPTDGDNVGQVLKHVVSRPFPPLAGLVGDLPPEVSALVERMLAREPALRPRDLHEVIAVLAPFASVSASPFGPPAANLREAELEAAAIAPTVPVSPLVRRDASEPRDPGFVDDELVAPAGPRLRRRTGAPRDPSAPSSMDDELASAAGHQFGHRTSEPRDPNASTDDELVAPAGPRLRRRTGAPRDPSARARPRLGRRAVLAAGAALIAVAGVSALLVRRDATAPAVITSPLADPAAVLACPILRASGVAEPSGWLGAAAAAMLCERARVVLGGRDGRTLPPAELLDMPRGPSDALAADPYGAADANATERSIAAARRRAQAYLDGEVARSSAGFSAALVLRRSDGAELARSTGRGAGLAEAVRSAMAPLIGGALPEAAKLDPAAAAWARTDRIDDALASLDLVFALDESAGELPEACERFTALAGRLRERGAEGRWLCAYALGQPLPEVALDASDASDAGRATRIRIDHEIHQLVAPGDPEFLRGVFQREATPRGRSLAAVTESCVQGATAVDAQAARERAIAAVQSDPANPEGGLCNPWEQLMTVERDTAAADGAIRAMQAWEPWNSYAWLEPAFRADGADPATLPLVARAYALSPLDTLIARTLARGELAAGDRAAARGVAADLRKGGLPAHDLESDLILAQIEASEAQFGQALVHARRASALAPGDTGWVQAQRFEAGWRALELAVVLGRAREVADDLIARFVDREPTLLDANTPAVPLRLPAICALGSAPPRCFARIAALRPRLLGAITPESDALAAGAERYAARDLAGAARAWRPLLGGRMVAAAVMPEAMAEAFERTGAPDLAERVDREVTQRAGELNGATLGHVRQARRAAAHGNTATARRIAEQVIAAWSVADDEPPAVAEMRRLVSRLPPAR